MGKYTGIDTKSDITTVKTPFTFVLNSQFSGFSLLYTDDISTHLPDDGSEI